MLSPAYLTQAANRFRDLWNDVELEALYSVGSSIGRLYSVNRTPEQFMRKKIHETSIVTNHVNRLMKAIEKKSASIAYETLEEATVRSLAFDDSIYRQAGLEPSPIEDNPTIQQMMGFALASVLLRMKQYSSMVRDSVGKAIASVSDKMYLQSQSRYGLDTSMYDDQYISLVGEMSRGGYIQYAEPGTWTAGGFAYALLLSWLNQSTSQVQLVRADEMNAELVEVSAHGGARPTHQVWQGGIYSLTGAWGTHRVIDGRWAKYDDFYSATGYGTVEGLCGINCRHSFFPYFEGYSTPTYSNDESDWHIAESGDVLYNDLQRMNNLERAVNESERRLAIYNSAISEMPESDAKNRLVMERITQETLLHRRQMRLENFAIDANIRKKAAFTKARAA